jgi:hypothetical protein
MAEAGPVTVAPQKTEDFGGCALAVAQAVPFDEFRRRRAVASLAAASQRPACMACSALASGRGAMRATSEADTAPGCIASNKTASRIRNIPCLLRAESG